MNESTGSEVDWFSSKFREAMDVGESSSSSQPLCKRCKELNLLDWLQQDISIKGDMDLTNRKLGFDDKEVFRKLGAVGSIVLRSDCALCRCIFGLAPSPDSHDQEVVLVLSWSMYRLEASIHMDTKEKRTASKHISAMLYPSQSQFTIAGLSSTRGDGLCIAGDSSNYSETTLGARIVNPNTLDLKIVQNWLFSCQRLHPLTCSPSWSEDIRKIFLIDVSSRHITSYPSEKCEYLALSYVWGEFKQDIPNAGRPGTALEKVPRTVEDAMSLVKELGKQYLWVDSICINQSDEDEKLEHMGIMNEIYGGAYATIIALSGDSANAGLSRVRSSQSAYHQLNCTLDGKRLVGLGPTLSQLVWVLPWGSRAWTFQEALLSPRCIYITNYQAYFECNSMQCCESLDESRSWVHQSLRMEAPIQNPVPTFGTGVLRSPFIPQSRVYSGRLEKYSTLLTLYKYRSLTKQSDAIHAFAGVLQALEKSEYTEGFFWGLPIADLNWALLWNSQAWWPLKRREGFPTWSWAGWEGSIWPGKPSANRQGDPASDPRQYPVDLRMWRKRKDDVELIFDTSHHDIRQEERWKFPNDPLAKDLDLEESLNDFLATLARLSPTSSSESNRLLCIQGITFHFAPDLSNPDDDDFDSDGYQYFTMYIRGIRLILRIIRTNELVKIPSHHPPGAPRRFLLLARNFQGGWIEHSLLLLKQKGEEFWERCGVVSMEVQRERLGVLEELGMRKERLLLA